MIEIQGDYKDAVKKWNGNELIWSASLGGIGPAYEQSIQILLWEILARWGDLNLPNDDGENFPEIYSKHVNDVVHDLNRLGVSGAQVAAAKCTAYQFLKFGYAKMMNKLDENRWILVSRNFPETSPVKNV